MWRWIRNRKAQVTAVYAILFAIVLGAAIGMQNHIGATLKGRYASGCEYMAGETSGIGTIGQYEPESLSSDFATQRESTKTEDYDSGVTDRTFSESSSRTGTSEYSY